MTKSEHQDEANPEKFNPRNPVDHHRKGAWEKVGEVIHGGFDRGGKTVRWGAEVGATCTRHGREVADPVGEMIGNVARGTWGFVTGIVRGIRGETKENKSNNT